MRFLKRISFAVPPFIMCLEQYHKEHIRFQKNESYFKRYFRNDVLFQGIEGHPRPSLALVATQDDLLNKDNQRQPQKEDNKVILMKNKKK